MYDWWDVQLLYTYDIFYKKLAGQNDSGLSFNVVKTYIVGIRNDLYHREFYFPEARYDKNDIGKNRNRRNRYMDSQ